MNDSERIDKAKLSGDKWLGPQERQRAPIKVSGRVGRAHRHRAWQPGKDRHFLFSKEVARCKSELDQQKTN